MGQRNYTVEESLKRTYLIRAGSKTSCGLLSTPKCLIGKKVRLKLEEE